MNNGVTLVSRDTFVNARPVARNLGRFDARQLENARVERRIEVQPVRASVLGSGAPARFRPPQAIVNRQVVATQRPAPPRGLSNSGRSATACGVQGNARVRARIVRWRDRNTPVNPPESVVRPQMPRPEARPQQPVVAPRVAEPTHPERQMAPRAPQGAVNQTDNRRFGKAGRIPRPGQRRRCRNETRPRRGRMRTSSATGSNSASRRRRRRTARRRNSARLRVRPREIRTRSRNRRVDVVGSAVINCQFPNRDWQFFYAVDETPPAR